MNTCSQNLQQMIFRKNRIEDVCMAGHFSGAWIYNMLAQGGGVVVCILMWSTTARTVRSVHNNHQSNSLQ